MKQPTAPIYSELPVEDGQNYRLHKISELEQRLSKERDTRKSLYKKYKRGINIVDGIDTALIFASLGLEGAGVGLISTVIAAPIVLGMETAALFCGLLGVASKFVSRKLQSKAKKHDEIRMIAESKLNSIKELVSRSLADAQITEQEFKLILEDVDRYTEMKKAVRLKKSQIGEDEKKNLYKKAGQRQ